MNQVAARSRDAVVFLGIALLGATLSFGLYQVWQLERRWMIICFVAIAAVAVSLCFAKRFGDFLLIAAFFSIPFATFTKWLYPADLFSGLYQGALIGTFGIGLIDLLLAGLYMSWFYRVFIIRIQ